ncbi:MAG: AAA family ATPase [Candidatus Bathyarchaeota archaeon]|nr:AAA family ATPase [Candidatus Bathyarchaeota archaeon]MDH5494165.1 AAA family ATPase [Candidatus Bathyarchaeota archaeon]
MKQIAEPRSIVHAEIFNDRVPTGVKGLDELIEGGLPRGSLTILAGSPGSGKTIASAQFLHHGATECGENGVYVSFSERKDVFIKNMEKFGLDFAEFERRGVFKFLDFATTRETGISSTLHALLKEAFSIKAKRLVVDSFSAMALAFEKKIDARVVLHTFEKLMRQAACTTLLLVEVPTGSLNLGLGFEEFVADGLILFETIEDETGIKKRAIIRKMRGTNHNHNYRNIIISDKGISLTPYIT